tara:strand:- start:95 stop:313 length:219 start_codon:yes stop_codon:yes gene_type:complete
MDGINEYLNNPCEWAVLVVLENINIKEKNKHNQKFVEQLLNDGIYEFIIENFLEFDLPLPSKVKIVSEVIKS